MAKALAEVVEQAKLKAFHGSPYKFDEFSDDAIGTGEGAQAYGYGHYLAEREQTAQSYKHNISEEKTSFTHPEHDFVDFGGARSYIERELKKQGFDDDAAQEAADVVSLGLLEGGDLSDFKKFLEKNSPASLVDTPQNYYDAYLSAINLAKPIKVERLQGQMYEVLVDASDDDLLDFDAPVNQQPKVMRAFFDQVIEMESDAPGEMRGMDLLRDLGAEEPGRAGQYSSPAAAKKLREAGFKGIKYADAQTRFSPGQKTSNYVIFDPRLIEISRRYGIPITAAATMLQQQDARAADIPTMEGVAQRAQQFTAQRDSKNKAWSNLKDAVGKMTQPFQPLAEFMAHSAAGMASGAGAAVAYDTTQLPAAMIEQGREMVRGIPEQMGFGPMDENAYQIALNQAIEGIAETVLNENAMRAFVAPVVQDVAPQLLNEYQQLDPRTQGMLSGLGEYIGNAIR